MLVKGVEDCHEFPCLCTHIDNRDMEAYDVGDMMKHIGPNNVMLTCMCVFGVSG